MILRLTSIFLLFSLSGATGQLTRINSETTIVHADERVHEIALRLQGILNQMTGDEIPIRPNAERGIFLEVANQPPGIFERERYQIRTDGHSVRMRGATPLALEHAVWDFLHRLGYRQFFPGKTWEVIPTLSEVAIDLAVDETPDYFARRIWYGYGTWEYNDEPYRDWCAKNRTVEGVKLRSGHAYGAIIRNRKADFDAHPEYYALRDGERDIRPQAKLCIGNPELRQLVADYALDYFDQNPNEDCVSVDPSDGGGWCECQDCLAIGSPSNRALLLANDVAKAVNADGQERFVGMYAYNYHSEPPTIQVHPKVIIAAATAFIKGGQTIDSVLAGWAKQGATMGIREYYSVNPWDRDLPGKARGSNLSYLAESIPSFHAQGARYLSAESSDNWGCNGLGYYFAARCLWDLDEASRKEAIIEDFLTTAFGPARKPMGTFYHLLEAENSKARLVHSDLLARMFQSLDEATTLAKGNEAVLARINQLVLYTRYVELFHLYRAAEGTARQNAFETMIRHVYRMRKTMLIHAKALYRDIAARDKSVTVPAEAGWQIDEAKNPWKSSAPFSETEIASYISDGLANYQPVDLDFDFRDFSEHLVPFQGTTELRSGTAEVGRGKRSWWTFTDQPKDLRLNLTGGLIKHYRDRGNVRIQLWKLGGASETGEKETLIAENTTVPPDGVMREVVLSLTEPGLYRIDLDDGRDMTSVTWPEDQLMTWKMSLEDYPAMMSGRWNLMFFVPKGTTRIGLYADVRGGRILRPDATTALEFDGSTDGQFLSIEVPEGMDGQLWKAEHMAGRIGLLNVPPWLAKSPRQLILPKEVNSLVPAL